MQSILNRPCVIPNRGALQPREGSPKPRSLREPPLTLIELFGLDFSFCKSDSVANDE
jgi:hypothetical protein